MTLRPPRPAAVAALAAVPVLALSACGTSGSDTGATPTSAGDGATGAVSPGSEAAGSAASELPPPTADELQDQFAKIIDPAVPVDQKAVLVEGGQEDPAAFDTLAQTLAASPDATMTLSEPVTDNGDGTVSVPFTAVFDGQQSQGDATFVAEDGTWKLSQANACAVLSLLSIPSPACPEA